MNLNVIRWSTFKTAYIVTSLIIILVGTWSLSAEASIRTPQRIVVLQSYHADFAWTDDIMKGLYKAFDKAEQKTEFYLEYMDTKRFPEQFGPEQLDSIQKHLTEKYRSLQPQIVITVDDDALRFMLDRHESIFPQIPVVFCGVNNPVDDGKIAASKVFTGVMEVLDRKETIDAALALHPETKKIAVITDTTTNGIGNRQILKELAKAYEGRIRFDFLDEDGTGITLDDLRSRVSKLNDDTIVYYGDFFRDKNGFIDQTDMIPILSRESRRPIYSPYSFVFGLGTVGGKLNSAIFQGEKAAQIALQILNGTSPSRIPVMKESVNHFMFDFRQMQRWNIPTDRLPAGSDVMYKSPSFFETYRQLVIATVTVFFILISVIFALIISIQRRKQAETARRQADVKLLASLEDLRESQQIAHVGSWRLDLASNQVTWSEELYKMYGFDPTLPPPPYTEHQKLFTPESWQRLAAALQNTQNTGNPYDLELETLRVDGSIGWMWVYGMSVRDAGGVTVGLRGMAQDITERKRSEAALKGSEERHRAILMTAWDGFWLVDASTGKLIEVNDAASSMLGYSGDEFLAKGLKDIDVQWSPEEIDREMQKIKAVGKSLFETQHRTKNGQIIDVEISVNYLPKTDQFFSFIRNITERKQIENIQSFLLQISSLGTGEDFFEVLARYLANILGMEYVCIDTLHGDNLTARTLAIYNDGKFEDNVEYALKDTPCGDVVGKEVCVFPREVRKLFPLDAALQDLQAESYVGTTLWGYDMKPTGLIAVIGRKELNSTHFAETVLKLVSMRAAGELERRKAEEQKSLFEQQFQQTQKLESLGVLAGGIAHDFNNILAIIMGYCSLTKMDYENAGKHIPEIEKAAERAAALCRQMLAYAGKASLTQSQVNTWLLVNEMVIMLKTTIQQNVVIKPELVKDIPAVTGDASQLRQVVMNLIINAAEAIGDAEGEIHVKLAKAEIKAKQTEVDHLGIIVPAGRYICIEVTDNGCGMDEATRRKIFEPFYTTKFTGRGLGMSAVLGIIKAHHGALQLESQPGQGTTFKVYLPVQLSKSETEEALQNAGSSAWRGSGTILLAEDEVQVKAIAIVLLQKLGFTVLDAANGKEALELYQQNAADITLVLTDMGMPVMNGYELFYKLKQLNPQLPIIISSGFGEGDIGSRIPREEIAGLINKPYNFDQMREVLRGVVEGV